MQGKPFIPGLTQEEWPLGHINPLNIFKYVFVWNVRGLNSRTRQDMTKAWIISNRLLFGAFTETHIQPLNSGKIVEAIPRGWRYHANINTYSMARIAVV